MSLRAILAILVVAATAAFVVGTSIERHDAHSERAAAPARAVTGGTHATPEAAGRTAETSGEGGGETKRKAGSQAGGGEAAPEGGGERPATAGEAGTGESAAHRAAETRHGTAELKPLGVDIEALPFVILAALTSIGLAVTAWYRPRWIPLLIAIVVAMLAFAVLDVREIAHQHDEGRTGLAVLAAVVAALHVAAALVAGLMARAARTTPVA